MSYLFEMTESQLDSAVQSHYDNMYRQAFETGCDPECSNCKHYYGGFCFLDDEAGVERDPDGYCDDHRFQEE